MFQDKGELIVACPPMRSNVNVSAIARAAGCAGAKRLILAGTNRILTRIARNSVSSASEDPDDLVDLSHLNVSVHRTLLPVLRKLKKEENYRIVGLEQTNVSISIYDYKFTPKTVLLIGNERTGIEPELLKECDDIIEIPVYGMPHAMNASHAAAVAMYEYCRQICR